MQLTDWISVGSGLATTIVAFATWKLATMTRDLVAETKEQGGLNAEADQRSYQLTLHEINLQYRASFYEQFVCGADDALDSLRLQAMGLGIDCNGLVIYSNPPHTTSSDYSLLGIQLRLHASGEVRKRVITWLENLTEELKRLSGLEARDPNGKVAKLTEPQLHTVSEVFLVAFGSLVDDKEAIVEYMINELHPETLLGSVNPH